MGAERDSWDALLTAWSEAHPGWQVVDYQLTVSWVTWGRVDTMVVLVQHRASDTFVNGVGSDLVTALQDVTYALGKRAHPKHQR
jgi:hypothetical protein